MKFPDGKNVSGDRLFSTALLEKSLTAVFNAKREVTGFLRLRCGTSGVYFLFFLKSSVYAAGKYFDQRPSSLAVKDFFIEVTSRSDEMIASLHEADPVLFKDFLIFLQDEPTLKAPVAMIDLDLIVRQIAREQSDALVVLESEGAFNFFYFKNGVPVMSHFSETCEEMEGLSTDEQMLLYAYRPGKQVNAYIYRNIVTSEAADSADGACILSMLHEVTNPAMTLVPEADLPSENVPSAGRAVRICITDGIVKGANYSLNIPFVIGRKEGELIIADPLVSKRHAVVREISGSLVIEDLGSTNGTFVNGVEIKLQQLTYGDQIKIGSSVLTIQPD